MTTSQSVILITFVVFFNVAACLGLTAHSAELESANFEGAKVQELEIKTLSADIKIAPSKSNKVEILLTGKKPKGITLLKTDLDSKSLEISIERPDDEDLNEQCKDLKLSITLPKKIYDELEIKSVSGDVNIDTMNTKESEIKTVSGDISLKDFKGDSAEIKSVSGDIDGNGLKMELEIKTVSGSAMLKSITLSKKLDFRSVSGDLNLQVDKKSGFTLDFSSTSGKVKTKLKGKKEDSGLFSNSVSLKYLDGKPEINARTVSGDVDLSITN